MAKNQTNYQPQPAATPPPVEASGEPAQSAVTELPSPPQPTAKPAIVGETFEVTLRRACGGCPNGIGVGGLLGTITLAPGVTMNFLVDSIANGFAADKRIVG